MPSVITADENPIYPIAIHKLKEEKKMPQDLKIRETKYLHNIVEQDHRFIRKLIIPMLGLNSFRTAKAIISGIAVIYMVKKVNWFYGTTLSQIK